ncbi:WhiB family transcriptional regulator [Streptomyces sp. NBC_00829]|uniref:WhiB family transcriptional regulator n=1 Tax=Streptomyces sp. NBC_00829 TaxID=2903679 RepID=UPI0038630F32|nr:WhiB family transcriptional regulator [Streptomyces sp. NBC_00829]
MTIRPWELSAACRDKDGDLWFSGRTRGRAVAICTACPVLDDCRAAVLRCEEGLPKCDRVGIIAALTGAQRYALEHERKRQQHPPPASDATDRMPAGRPARELAPCGTRAAYQRHLRRREPVDDACRAANSRGAGRYRRTGSTESHTAGS